MEVALKNFPWIGASKGNVNSMKSTCGEIPLLVILKPQSLHIYYKRVLS